MKPNQIAILVAYYFSKFDKEAMRNLGFKSDSEAFEETAKRLGVKRNYVKFRRDEFDPVHPWRKGWQRPMDNRIIRTIEALQDLSEADLREIVKKALFDIEYRQSEELWRITSLFAESKDGKKTNANYVLRGPTGRKAEEFFIQYFTKNTLPISGQLIDTRDLGCGYDFEIRSSEIFYVEVKGLAKESGGVLFTNKEWETAKINQDNFILALVSNIDQAPEIKFIYNPTKKLHANKNIVTTIQIQWSISANELKND